MTDNVWLHPTKFAETALALLRGQVMLPALFTNKFGLSDFAGAEGDVINIRRPPLLRAREKGFRTDNKIVVDNLEQTKIQVPLDSHPYNAVALTNEEETLDQIAYVRDVQAPQVRAMLEFYEQTIADALRGADFQLTAKFNPGSADSKESDPRKVASRARKLFQDAHVPTGGRFWLVGSSVAEAIRDTDKLLDVNTAGLPEAVREGVVSRLSGFTIIEVDNFDENESYFIHESAMALVTVAPAVPRSAVLSGGIAAGGGLALTQVWDYDGDLLKDRSVVHAYVGATPILDPKIDPKTGLIAKAKVASNKEEAVMVFVRAIKVTFGGATTAPETP